MNVLKKFLIGGTMGLAIVALCSVALPTNEASAAAPDGFTSQNYQDSNADGTVDRMVVVINGGEALDACVVTADELATDWTYTANGLTGSSIASASCIAGTATITFVITGAPTFTTGVSSAPTIAYDDGDADHSISNASGDLGTVAGAALADAAAPFVRSAVYLDATRNNGEVDAVRFTTTTDTGIACTAFTGNTDFTVGTAGTVTLASAAGDTCGSNGTSTVTITLATNGATDTTGGAVNPVVTYTQPGNGVEDGAGNDLPTAASVTVTDAANPIMVSATINQTASRNILTFVYSEAVTVTNGASSTTSGDLTSAGVVAGFTASFATAGNVTVPTTLNTVAGSGTTTITITIADQAAGYINNTSTTGPSGVVTPAASAAVVDAVSLQVNTSATPTATVTSAWTLTQPTIATTTISDADYDGRVDTATVVFSAAVRDANITSANGGLGGGAGTFATGTVNDNTTVFSLTADTLDINTSATAAHFTYSGATTKVTDLFGNLLNTTTDGTIVAADTVEVDNAPPVIVSTTPVSAGSGLVVTTSITVNFSESVTIAACTFSSLPDPGDFGDITSAGNWSAFVAGQATSSVTLDHTTEFNRSTSVAITIGGCTAAVGGAALHANAATPNPWTFNTVGSSSSGGGTYVPDPASVTLSIPNGGQTFSAGTQIGITWASANGAFTKFKVSYSADNGNTWTVLSDALTSSATSYTWTVPSVSTTQGKIKVEGIDANNVAIASDMSESTFSVAGTTVAPPPVAPPSAVVPAVDPTVHGSYDAATAKANNPTIADDKTITPVANALCTAGSLIKSSSLPAVYYCGADGKRYVFVNDKAFFSWYADFSSVKVVSDATLASITIGGNITYRPGTRMVKIQSDPKVYAVARGGVLRWVMTEAVANRLFGPSWNTMIDDVSDSFFVNYQLGDPITQ